MRNKLPIVLAALGALLVAVMVWVFNQEAKKSEAEIQALQQDLKEMLIQIEQTEEDLLWFLENKVEWVGPQSVDYFTFDPDSTPIIWRTTTFYEHASGKLFRSEHVIFGELVMKAYGVYDGDNSLQDYWIRVEKDGIWHTVKTDKLEFNLIKDKTETVIGVEIVLRDKDYQEIVRRTVRRKLKEETQNN